MYPQDARQLRVYLGSVMFEKDTFHCLQSVTDEQLLSFLQNMLHYREKYDIA